MTDMTFKTYRVRVVTTTSLLGTQPPPDVKTRYIDEKFRDSGRTPPPEGENIPVNENGSPVDEVESLSEIQERGTTVFHRDAEGNLIYYDYMVKGFLKEAGRTFNGLRDVKNLRSKIDQYVFVRPRQILLQLPEGAEVGLCERPLRAETAQGPRTALAKSEELPAGVVMEFTLKVYSNVLTEDLLRDLFSYGQDKGFGQWRNGSHGQFEFTLTKLD